MVEQSSLPQSLGFEPVSPSLSAAQLRQRLTEIDDEIDELYAMLAVLSTARESIVVALKSIIYPILTIPPEITAEIFMHCVGCAHLGRFREPYEPVFVLTSVCRMWRNMAFNLPIIWSHIRISNSIAQSQDDQNLLQCWLQRAKTQQLDLDMISSADRGPILALLVPYSARWRRFACSIDEPIQFPIETLQGHIPSLQSLGLQCDPFAPQPTTPIAAFADAPLLRKVSLESVSALHVSLPWGQLTELRCSGTLAARCLEILAQTPNLEILAISAISTANLPFSPIRLHHLHSLTFQDSDFRFFELITLPALKNLDIHIYQPAFIRHVSGLLERSRCSLVSLSLENVGGKTVVEFLKHTPTLSQLTIRKLLWDSHSYLFKNVGILIPQLEKLDIETSPTAIAYKEMTALRLGNSPDTNDERPPLQEFRFMIPSHPMYPFHNDQLSEEECAAADRKLREMTQDGRCKVNISGPHALNIRSDAPTRRNLSYTLADLYDLR